MEAVILGRINILCQGERVMSFDAGIRIFRTGVESD